MRAHQIFVALLGLIALLIVGIDTTSQASAQAVAIKGYDTVAYFTESKAAKGDPKYAYTWDGSTYYFSSANHLDLFKAAPDKYAPVYRGFCTAALSRGLRVVADPENWLIYDGKLHIFGKPIGPGLMKNDLEAMKHKADTNFPKVSELPEPKAQ